MKKKKKTAQSLIERIPLLSWYLEKQKSAYTIERAGKGLRLADAIFK